MAELNWFNGLISLGMYCEHHRGEGEKVDEFTRVRLCGAGGLTL
jgi:hypothetical protein